MVADQDKNNIYLNEYENKIKKHKHTLCCSIQNEAFCGRPKLRGAGSTKHSAMLPRDQALQPLVKVGSWITLKGEG